LVRCCSATTLESRSGFIVFPTSTPFYMFQDDGNPATADAPILVEKATAATLIDGNRVQFLSLKGWDISPNSGRNSVVRQRRYCDQSG
jgi:hypothetical protein